MVIYSNGEFQMTTQSDNNSFISDGILYIVPTLTSSVIGNASIFDGYTYNITGCTNTQNVSACGAVSNATTGSIINPVMSARISTKKSYNIGYGKVEVRAKLPTGDWVHKFFYCHTYSYNCLPALACDLDVTS